MHEPHKVANPEREIEGVRLYHRVRSDEASYPDAEMNLRICAFLIDLSFFGSLLRLLYLPFFSYMQLHELYSDQRIFLLKLILALIVVCFYLLLPLALAGQSLGMRAVGIRLIAVGHATSQPSLATIIWRESVAKVIMLVSLSFLVNACTGKQRLLHDLWTQTRVIKYRN